MSRKRTLAGGRVAVEVNPERLEGFLLRFGERHGGVMHTFIAPRRVRCVAGDGAVAEFSLPFGGLTILEQISPGLSVADVVTYLQLSRRIGIVLVRRGAYSVGITCNGRVIQSKTARRQVHGRHKAGGWSQQRFARRREGQITAALRAAADDVAAVLLPELSTLDGIVLGGDRSALAELKTDARLSAVFARAEERILDVPEPRREILDQAAIRALAVEVVLTEPADITPL